VNQNFEKQAIVQNALRWLYGVTYNTISKLPAEGDNNSNEYHAYASVEMR